MLRSVDFERTQSERQSHGDIYKEIVRDVGSSIESHFYGGDWHDMWSFPNLISYKSEWDVTLEELRTSCDPPTSVSRWAEICRLKRELRDLSEDVAGMKQVMKIAKRKVDDDYAMMNLATYDENCVAQKKVDFSVANTKEMEQNLSKAQTEYKEAVVELQSAQKELAGLSRKE